MLLWGFKQMLHKQTGCHSEETRTLKTAAELAIKADGLAYRTFLMGDLVRNHVGEDAVVCRGSTLSEV